mmetsp:Transcript_75365/g.203439  ORF Transcript_75365/g.203439 Transcript_75365/m.203439 type:complete len:250 (-) Transcript_75365:107-856(-)
MGQVFLILGGRAQLHAVTHGAARLEAGDVVAGIDAHVRPALGSKRVPKSSLILPVHVQTNFEDGVPILCSTVGGGLHWAQQIAVERGREDGEVRTDLAENFAEPIVAAPRIPICVSQHLTCSRLQILSGSARERVEVRQALGRLVRRWNNVDNATDMKGHSDLWPFAGYLVQPLPWVGSPHRSNRRLVTREHHDAQRVKNAWQGLEACNASVDVLLAHVAQYDDVARVGMQALEQKRVRSSWLAAVRNR